MTSRATTASLPTLLAVSHCMSYLSLASHLVLTTFACVPGYRAPSSFYRAHLFDRYRACLPRCRSVGACRFRLDKLLSQGQQGMSAQFLLSQADHGLPAVPRGCDEPWRHVDRLNLKPGQRRVHLRSGLLFCFDERRHWPTLLQSLLCGHLQASVRHFFVRLLIMPERVGITRGRHQLHPGCSRGRQGIPHLPSLQHRKLVAFHLQRRVRARNERQRLIHHA